MSDSSQHKTPEQESDRDLIKRVRYEHSLPVQSQFVREDVRRLANRLESTLEQLERVTLACDEGWAKAGKLEEQYEETERCFESSTRSYEKSIRELKEQLEAFENALQRIYWNGVSGDVEEWIIDVLPAERRAEWFRANSNPANRPIPDTDKMSRRPVYDRVLRRRHQMPLDPPSEDEKRDAILVLRDPWLWIYELNDEAFRIFDEASQ